MNFLNLLASDPVIPFLGKTYDISLNWLGHLIRVLIEGIGVVGIGIIVFSIILRLVVLPFDIYQRVTMRKQNIKMKENKDKMEKLQKQYAGDKAMYNQKLMEMYKENGISMFSSCLPAIISLVVFIVAINAFNAFSQYANMQNYNLMANSYNEYLNPYCAELKAENIDDNYIITKENEDGTVTQTRHILVRETADSQSGKTKCIYYTLIYNENYAENDYRYIKDTEKTYYVDAERLYASSEKLENADGSATTWKERVDALVSASADTETPIKMENACREVLVSAAQDNVKHTYDTEVVKRMKFLWVKNIWATDATFKHPVLNYNDFKSSVSNGKFSVDGEKVKFANISGHTGQALRGKIAVQRLLYPDRAFDRHYSASAVCLHAFAEGTDAVFLGGRAGHDESEDDAHHHDGYVCDLRVYVQRGLLHLYGHQQYPVPDHDAGHQQGRGDRHEQKGRKGASGAVQQAFSGTGLRSRKG